MMYKHDLIEYLQKLLNKASAPPWRFWGGSATYAINAQREPHKSFRICGHDTDAQSDRPGSGTTRFGPSAAGFLREDDVRLATEAVNALPELLSMINTMKTQIETATMRENILVRRLMKYEGTNDNGYNPNDVTHVVSQLRNHLDYLRDHYPAIARTVEEAIVFLPREI